jgi:ubiquinone/menaquinone biosynthesis C-methylase UbiE
MMQAISLADVKKQVSVLQIAERFFDSVVLFALFETGVLKAMSGGAQSLAALHAHVGGNLDSLRAALDAAVALKILSIRDGRYAADEAILDCLAREDSPAYLGEWITFLHALAMPLLKLAEVIQTGRPIGAFIEGMGGDSAPARTMTKAMDAYARTRGIEMLDHLDFSTTKRLLDLGCGPGTYSLAIVERHPHVHATLLDLPEPIAQARRLAAKRPAAGQVEFVAADARAYTPSELFDTILISNTLHLIGPVESPQLLKRCYGMLSPGGQIIVQAQYLNDDRTTPRWPTLLNLTQRVASEHGRNHAITETTEWLQQAGFRNVRHVRFSVWNVNSCLVADRPSDS